VATPPVLHIKWEPLRFGWEENMVHGPEGKYRGHEKPWEGVLKKGDCVVGKKDVVTVSEHAFGEVTHGRSSLDVEVA
jgi:hypothetical protein